MKSVWIAVCLTTFMFGTALAEEFAFYSDSGNRLFRHSLEAGDVVEIGGLADRVVRLAFSPQGELFAVANRDDEVIVQVLDISDASSRDVVTLPGQASRVRGMTIDDQGVLWITLAGPPVVGSTTELIRYDLDTAQISSTNLDKEVSLLAMSDGTLFGIREGMRLSTVDASTGTVTDLFTGIAIVGADGGADFSSDGLLWLAKLGAVDPPFGPGTLEGVRVATQEVVSRFTGLPEFVAGLAITDLPSDGGLLLNDGRFHVRAVWRDFEGQVGEAQVVPFSTNESGIFYFFNADNWELMVKVLDGCSLNQHYWFFAAATTDVEFTLEVTDLESGLRQEYFNALGVAAPAITDTTAFASCP